MRIDFSLPLKDFFFLHVKYFRINDTFVPPSSFLWNHTKVFTYKFSNPKNNFMQTFFLSLIHHHLTFRCSYHKLTFDPAALRKEENWTKWIKQKDIGRSDNFLIYQTSSSPPPSHTHILNIFLTSLYWIKKYTKLIRKSMIPTF